jgi:hypothetical protein
MAANDGHGIDIAGNPVPEFHTSFDILRFYISQASLDELSFDRGLRRAWGGGGLQAVLSFCEL